MGNDIKRLNNLSDYFLYDSRLWAFRDEKLGVADRLLLRRVAMENIEKFSNSRYKDEFVDLAFIQSCREDIRKYGYNPLPVMLPYFNYNINEICYGCTA